MHDHKSALSVYFKEVSVTVEYAMLSFIQKGIHLKHCMFLHRPLLESSLYWMTVDILSVSVHWKLLFENIMTKTCGCMYNIHIPSFLNIIRQKINKMIIIITAITMTTNITITTTRAITVHVVIISVEYTIINAY